MLVVRKAFCDFSKRRWIRCECSIYQAVLTLQHRYEYEGILRAFNHWGELQYVHGRYEAWYHRPNRTGGDAVFVRHAILTLDWDIQGKDENNLLGDAHAKECCTVSSEQEVANLLKSDSASSGRVWALQRTRGGFHGVCVGGPIPDNLCAFLKGMRCDPQYIENVLGNVERDPTLPFDWRLTAKCEGDFVVEEVALIGPLRAIDPVVLGHLVEYYGWVEELKDLL